MAAVAPVQQALLAELAFGSFASFLVIVYLISNWKLMKKMTYRLLLYLSVSDFVGAMLWLIETATDITVYPGFTCPYLLISTYFFTQSAAIWTCVIGFNLWWSTRGKHCKLKHEIIYGALSMLVPLIGTLFITGYHAVRWRIYDCFMDPGSPLLLFTFTIPKLLWMALNILFLSLVIYELRESQMRVGGSLKSQQKTLMMIQVCFIIYSISGLIVVDANASQAANQASTIISAAQPILNAIVVGRKPLLKIWNHHSVFHTSTDDEESFNNKINHTAFTKETASPQTASYSIQ